MPLFSVIIATRNRPSQFGEALNSVIAQTCTSIEIIVVNDGSADDCLHEYLTIIGTASRPVAFHSLIQRPLGHGPAHARNFGAERANGDFLCFLDDDDLWTDERYLERVARTISESSVPVDLHMAGQAAFRHGVRTAETIWLNGLAESLSVAQRRPNGQGAFPVSMDDLMDCEGFCHLNTLIVRRSLFAAAGGMDERLGWEEDRDLYLRLLNRAKVMFYIPDAVSRHNIPDSSRTSNVSTALCEIERRLFQLRVFDKATLFATHPLIRAEGLRQKGYTIKRIAELLASQGDYAAAAHYARLALGAKPTLKWLAYTSWVMLKAGLPGSGRQPPFLATQATDAVAGRQASY